MTPGEVAAAVHDDPAYDTVQTILSRLHAKGAVNRELDHTAVLRRFLGTLDAEQRTVFASLLQAEQQRDG